MMQRSPEWFAARAGKATSSRVADLCARTKSGWGASRGNCIADLVTERLTGVCAETPQTAAMAWGVEKEDEARLLYEVLHGVSVKQVGFVDHPEIAWAGASPDGLIGDDGLIEIKCPASATHQATLEGASVPARYNSQMQWQMDCTGRDWCAFASYDPRMPPTMQLHVQDVKRDESVIEQLREDVESALAEVERRIEILKEMYE